MISTFLSHIQNSERNIEERKEQIKVFLNLLRESLDEIFKGRFELAYEKTYVLNTKHGLKDLQYELETTLKGLNIGKFKFYYGLDAILISEFYPNLNSLKEGIILRNNSEKYIKLNFDGNNKLFIKSFVNGDDKFNYTLGEEKPLTKENLKAALSDLFNSVKIEL